MSAFQADGIQNAHLLTGPYRSGKTSRILERAIEFKVRHPLSKSAIVVPSARYATALRKRLNERLLAMSDKTRPVGIFGLEILPFYEACRHVLRLEGLECRILPDELRIALIGEIVAELTKAGKLNTLAPISQFQGTLPSIVELIDELERAGKSPDEVIETLAKSAGVDSLYRELALIYKYYWQECTRRKVFDLKRVAMVARELLHGSKEMPDEVTADEDIGYNLPPLTNANGEPFEELQVCGYPPKPIYHLLLIDGFDRISHLQAQIIGGLVKRAKESCIAFDFLDDWDAAEFEQALGSENRIDEEKKDCGGLRQTKTDYDWKRSSYTELTAAVAGAPVEICTIPEQTGEIDVVCFSTLDRFLEMREIARLCKQSILVDKVPPNQILVVARSIENYNGAVEAAFDEAGMEYFIDGSIKVDTLPIWHFVINLLSLPVKNYVRRDVIDILRSNYLNREALGVTAESLSRLDAETFRFELVSGRDSWQRFFEKLPAERQTDKAAILSFFDALDSLHRPELDVESRITIIEDLLSKLLAMPATQRRKGSINARIEQEFMRALRRVFKVMLLHESLIAPMQETGEEFLKRLSHYCQNSSFARPVGSRNGVMICSADLVPAQGFEHIFIAGMVEGDFPRRSVGRGFLATDQVRRWLSYGIDIQNPRSEPSFERALFYSLLERAQKKVVLSLPQFEMDGSEPIPSFYLKELEETGALKMTKMAPFAGGLTMPVAASEAVASALWIGGADHLEQICKNNWQVEEYATAISAGLSAAGSRSHAERNQIYNAYLSDFVETGALTVPLPEAWTASKLNNYGQCPFRFWAGNILKLEPRDEAEAGLTAQRKGELYHKVLELFFSKWRANFGYPDSGSPPSEQEEQELVDHAFNAGIALVENNPAFVAGPWWEQDKKEMLFRLRRFITAELIRLRNDEDRLWPALFEVSFGTEEMGSAPPLILTYADQTVQLRGTVDRVDLPGGRIPAASAGVNAKVVDYKSGSKSITFKEATSGRNMQVPLYALAVERAILPGSSVLGGTYLSISQAKPSGNFNFTQEKHASVPARTERLVGEFVKRVKKGDFVPAPGAREVCTQCPQKTVCRVKEMKGFMEAESDASD